MSLTMIRLVSTMIRLPFPAKEKKNLTVYLCNSNSYYYYRAKNLLFFASSLERNSIKNSCLHWSYTLLDKLM